MALPVIAVVGKPNVGKSTLFNRILGERKSIVDDSRGVTRDRIYSKSIWGGKEFILIDTGGIDVSDTTFASEVSTQAKIAITEADIIVFVVDGRSDLTAEDLEVAEILHRSNKPVLVAVNKIDDVIYRDNVYNFYELGFSDCYAVSSIHGIGVGEILEKAVNLFAPKTGFEDDSIKFALIGRPNVGKSSILNALLNENRTIVSDIAGTTRDSIHTKFKYNGEYFTAIDTAGIRRKGKVFERVEKYSVIRSKNALNECDVAVLVIDASMGIVEHDKNILGYAIDAGCAVLIVVNKWDLVEKDHRTMKEWEDNLKSHFIYASYAKIIFTSATNKQRLHNILEEVQVCAQNHVRRVQTSHLNNILMNATALHQAPKHHGGRLKVYYGSQVSVGPPTFALFVNDANYAHFSYMRYLENRVREVYDFSGTPIKFVLRNRK